MDVIDTLAGIAPGSHLDAVRRTRRPVAREHAQKSYDSLFTPAEFGDFGPLERFAVAVFVAGLHGQAADQGLLCREAAQRGRDRRHARRARRGDRRGEGQGPYGAFPKGPLSKEDTTGPVHRVADGTSRGAGAAARGGVRARAHAGVPSARCRRALAAGAARCRLVARPSVVTLSQLVAFLSFQIRVVAGLKVLAAKREASHDRQDHPAVRPCRARPSSPATCSTGCRGSSRWRPTELTERQLASLVDAARAKSAVFPAAGARSRRARGAHPHRQGHLLQSRRRPAARRARARRRRDLALQRLHLLRLGACPVRRDLFQAHATTSTSCWPRASASISTSAGTRSSRPRSR